MKTIQIILISIVLGIPIALFVPNTIAIIAFYGFIALMWFFFSMAPAAGGWKERSFELDVILGLIFCVIVALSF